MRGGEQGGFAGGGGEIPGAAGKFSEAEVENFRGAAMDQENIGGLDVAVDDSFGVSGIEAVGDLNAEIQKFADGELFFADASLQGLAFEQFHGDERAALEFADIVDGADVGMIERGGGAGLAAETFDSLGVMGDIIRQKFESDVAAEAGVGSFVNDAHAAAAEFFEDVVMGNGTTNDESRVRHLLGEFTAAEGRRQSCDAVLVGFS